MDSTLRLFYRKNIYEYGTERIDRLFFDAFVHNVRHHLAHCPEYAELLRRQGFVLEQLQSIRDLHTLPPLPTLFLKRHTLLSTQKRLLLRSTTSGTSGHVSVVGLDWPSVWRGAGMVLGELFTHRLLSPHLTNYIVLGYEPAKRNEIGAAKTAYAMTFAAPALHRTYALKDTGTEYVLNVEGLKTALLQYEKSRRPVRFMGFPAYFMFLLQALRAAGIRLRLHPKSLVMLHGGWKSFSAEAVDKETLYALSEETIGLGADNFREFFGAVEHPIMYTACKNHHFHIPVYARVIIRDMELNPVGYGVPGILNLITPMISSMPLTSVLTDDLAVLRPGAECGCGISAPYLQLLGRAGLTDIKTCAAGAAELLSVMAGGDGK